MASNVETKLGGLYLTGNELNAPEGSLTSAEDVWHPEANVLGPRPYLAARGAIPGTLANANAIIPYGKDKLVYDPTTENLAKYDESDYLSIAYSQTVPPAHGTTRMKGAQAGKNLYVTAADGLYRISGDSEPDLAGAPVATGFVSAETVGTAGWLSKDTTVAYRNLFVIRDSFDRIYVGSPSGRILVTNSSAGTRNVEVSVLIPKGIQEGDYLRVYRTAEIESAIDPGDEMGLIHETRVTATMVADGLYTFTDTTPSEIRGLNLYTNPNSGQGILQANDIPPVALDVTTWGNRLWVANTKRAHSLSLELLGVGAGAPGSNETGMRLGDQFIVEVFDADGVSEEVVTFVAAPPGSGAPPGWDTDTVNFTWVVDPLSAANSVRETIKNLVEAINRSELLADHVRAIHTSGPEEPQGRILLERVSPAQGRIEVSAGTQEIRSIDHFTVQSAVKSGLTLDVDFAASGWGVNDLFAEGDTGHGAAFGMDLGAELFGIVGPTTVLSVVGYSVAFEFQNPVTNYGNGISNVASFTYKRFAPTAGTAWSPNLDVPRESKNDAFPHRLCYSKLDEFEAFPRLNYLDIGDETKNIQRIVPMRDRLYVFKDDGVFLVSGEFPFRVDLFDPSLKDPKPDSVAVANNIIFGVFENRVYAITEGGARQIDGNIETGSGWSLDSDILAAGDTRGGRYVLWDANNPFRRAHVYNIKLNHWVRWNMPTKAASVAQGASAFEGNLGIIQFGKMMRLTADESPLLGGDYLGGYTAAAPTSSTYADVPTVAINPLRPIRAGDYVMVNNHVVAVAGVVEVGANTRITFSAAHDGDLSNAEYLSHFVPFWSQITWTPTLVADASGRKLVREIGYIFSLSPAVVQGLLDSDNTPWGTGGTVEDLLDTEVPPTDSYAAVSKVRRIPRVVRQGVSQDHADCYALQTGLSIKSKFGWVLVGRILTFEKTSEYPGAV